MQRATIIGLATFIAAAVLTWGRRTFGARSVWFAFFTVWVPMTWLGTISRVAPPRLPASYHRLRAWERDGRIYERLGVTAAKAALRRGPLAVFNPQLHLPEQRTPERLEHLEQKMCEAEASHFMLMCANLGVAARVAARGHVRTAGWMMLFDALMNGYPVMLQRYNRALLHRRFSATAGDRGDRSAGRA